MKQTPSLRVAQVLKQHGLLATKRLGQNFLEDPEALQQIADAADIGKEDVVLEIGPGLGSLTRFLSARAREVVTVELDRKLIPLLRGELRLYQNTRIVEGDILALAPAALALPEGYIVAANIPYNITSAVLRHLLSSRPRPRQIVLTIQGEVAERICAAPPDMSQLALSVQVYGKPEIVARIPAAAFFPVPKVDSAVIRIEIYPRPVIEPELLPVFFELMKAGFSQKRKTLRNALSAGLRIAPAQAGGLLGAARIDPQRRAETLSLQEWDALSRAWEAEKRGRAGQPAY